MEEEELEEEEPEEEETIKDKEKEEETVTTEETPLQPQEELPLFTAVEESYFDDALFIGDSRMVGVYEYAGLENATSGKVFLEGNDVTDLPPEKRPVNTVFQNYALLGYHKEFPFRLYQSLWYQALP